MFYGIPVQRCHMPPSRTHVLGLACSPFWQIRFFRTLASSCCSQWQPTTKVLFQLLNVLAGDRVLFTHNRRYYNVLQGGMTPSFLKAYDVLLGTPGASLDLFSPDKGTDSSNSIISKNSWTTTTSFVSRKCMQRTSFFKLSRYWLHDFDSLVRFYLIMKIREDRLSASTGIFFLKTQL